MLHSKILFCQFQFKNAEQDEKGKQKVVVAFRILLKAKKNNTFSSLIFFEVSVLGVFLLECNTVLFS